MVPDGGHIVARGSGGFQHSKGEIVRLRNNRVARPERVAARSLCAHCRSPLKIPRCPDTRPVTQTAGGAPWPRPSLRQGVAPDRAEVSEKSVLGARKGRFSRA